MSIRIPKVIRGLCRRIIEVVKVRNTVMGYTMKQ